MARGAVVDRGAGMGKMPVSGKLRKLPVRRRSRGDGEESAEQRFTKESS